MKRKTRKIGAILVLVFSVVLGPLIIGIQSKDVPNEGIENTDNKQEDEEKLSQEAEKNEDNKSGLLDADTAQALVPSKGNGEYAEDDSYEAEEIVCNETAVFSGQFVEDGRDELVKNVAAIQVTNNSEEYLEFSTLLYEIDGKTATFVVTGLPPGRTAWVLEKSRMVVDGPDGFVYKGSTTSFRENVVSSVEGIHLTANGNMLTATNQTQSDIESLVVYYKVLHTDGNYLGGITYLVDFGSVKSGESVETLAGHYKEGSTEIVRIDCK